MRFQVAHVKASQVIHKADIEAASFLGRAPQQLQYKDPLSVYLEASIVSEEMLVRGKFWSVVSLTCGKCLERFDRPIKGEFGQSYELLTDVIDVSTDLREIVVLEFPDYAICSPQCKGLCQDCGTNLNKVVCGCHHDQNHPKWAALKDFKIKERKN